MDLSPTVDRITGILGKIAELTSSYNEAMRLMGGLSGALVVLTEFVQRRIGDGNEVDPQAFGHLTGTLAAIEEKIDEIHATLGKRWGCFPYGKWYVYGAPLAAPCFGRAGSTKLIKQLTDLEGDLSGDIKFLELQMTANAVQSLSALSRVQAAVSSVFAGQEARDFWLSSFGEEFYTSQDAVAAKLAAVVRQVHGQHSDSGLSKAARLCAFLAADMARAATVSARAFAARVGDRPVAEWVSGEVGGRARAVLLPGHHGAVTCMASAASTLVTGGLDSTVKVFSVSEQGVPILRSTMVGHNDPVTGVDVCPSRSAVVSGARDGFVRVWSLYTGEPLKVYPASGSVSHLACSDAGHVFYSCDAPSMSVAVRDVLTGDVVAKKYGHVGGVTGMAAGRTLLTGGADRSLKEWSLAQDGALARVPQVHPTAVRFVLRCRHFAASVSDNEIRFYSPDTLAPDGEAVRLREKVGGGGSVVAAGVLEALGCVAAVTTEAFGDLANARLRAAFPGGGAPLDTPLRTDAKEAPTAMACMGATAYVGFSTGSIRWYSADPVSGFREMGAVGPAGAGSEPLLAGRGAAPLMASSGEAAVTAHPAGGLVLHPSGARVALPAAATALAPAEDGDGWLAAHGRSIAVLDGDGAPVRTIEVGTEVAGIQSSRTRRKVFVDLRRKHGARSVAVLDTASGLVNDLVSEPLSRQTPCAPRLVLHDRFLVWPGYFDGTLAVLDTVDLRTLEPVKYSHLEVDPVSCIASAASWFVTLHGGLDVLLWNDAKAPPLRHLQTFRNPISSIAVSPSEKIIAGCCDGSVFVDADGEEVYVDHAVGPVAVSPGAGSGFFSVGVEGSLVRHRAAA